MNQTVDLGGAAGSVKVHVDSGGTHAGLADLTVQPRYGAEAIVTMNASECRKLSDLLARAAKVLEG